MPKRGGANVTLNSNKPKIGLNGPVDKLNNSLNKVTNNKAVMRMNSPTNKLNNLANNKPVMRMNNSMLNKPSANNSVKKPQDYTVIIIIVVSILVVMLLAFFAYRYISNKKIVSQIKTKELVPYIHDAKTMTRISNGNIPVSTERNSYNYNFWMYVNDYDYRNAEDKCVLFKGSLGESVHSNDTNENPGVYLLKNNNTLRVLINLETSYNPLEKSVCTQEPIDESNESNENDIVSVDTQDSSTNAMPLNENFVGHHDTSNVKPGCDHCDIEYFPLQRWVSVNIAITNNVLDISIDGKLKKSCVLSGSPSVNNRDLLVCPEGGFNGFIANLKASNKALPVKEILKLYKKGPSLKPGLLN